MVGALDDHPLVVGRVETAGHRDSSCAGDGGIGMWRTVYDRLAGFDEQLPGFERADFRWRAAYVGIRTHFEPGAVVHRHSRPSSRVPFGAAVRTGMAEPPLFRRHRARAMPRSPLGETLARYRWLAAQLPQTLAGPERDRWLYIAGTSVGRLAGSLRHRVIYL
jgi:hypothetical protein